MIYQEIKEKWLTSMLPDGAKLYMSPELPKFSFTYNKVKYTVPDVRLLNVNAIQAILYIVGQIVEKGMTEQVTCKYTDDFNDAELEIISAIVTGLVYEAKRGGKNGFSMCGHFLTNGFARDEKTLTFTLIEEHAKVIYKYAREKKEVSFYDLIIACVENHAKELPGLLDNPAENGNNNMTNG